MKKYKNKKAQKQESDEDSQEYQECECCKRKQLIESQSKKLQFDQAMIDLLNQTSKKLPANVNLDCIVTPNGMKLIFEQKSNKSTQKLDADSAQKQQVFESFSKQVRENPEILNEVYPYNQRIYQVDLDNYLFKDGKQIYENQWLLNELDQKNCFREEYLPVMKYIDLEKFETGINMEALKQIFGESSNALGEEQKSMIENLKDKIQKEQEQRIKEYLKIHYNDTKIIKRIIVPGDHVEQYYSKNAKDWFKENVIKLIKDKNEKGSISIQENTIISSNQKDFQQTASDFFNQIESTGSTGSDGQNCEIQEVFNESSSFIMAMNERKNMAADQSPGDMKCFQQNLTMMAFLKPNTIKCSTVISSQNFTVKTSISSQDSPKKKSKNKEIKFYQDCAILDALPFGFGQIDNFIRRRDCDGSFKENFIENDIYIKDKLHLIKKKSQHTYYKFTMSILDGGCGDIRSFRELKIFQSQRNKFNYNQFQQSKVILPVLIPLCQISLKDDQTSENQMYFVLQYLNRTKIGEASYNFIPQSLHTYLVCKQFGKCSLDSNQVGLKCFCKRNIVLFINLIQKKELIADNRDNINRALSQFLYRGYDILIFNDITKKQKFKETFQADQIFQINHQLKLMEIDLHDLKLKEEESAPSKIYKYRIQAHKDLHNSRFLYFLMTQIHEKLFYGQQNNFKCFSLYDCRKLAILENYAMQTLLVKQTGLLLMNEMIPADQIQNYDATIEFQRNHNEIDSNFAIYILIQICLAQNLQQSASKYFELLSKNEQIERPISDKSSTNHNRKCEAFSINIEKEKCKNLCFLNNNIKNLNSVKELKIQSYQPKIDPQFWNETDKKLKWLGIEETIQDNLQIGDKKTDKNKQNDQICVIKNILQFGDDPESYKYQSDLKSLKKVIKQQVYGIKINVRILSNTEWIQRKKIDNFDGMKIQPFTLINDAYHEIKINNQNKNYWYFILRCMNLGEISEFWVNSNCDQNLQMIELIQEFQPEFFDLWSRKFRQTQVIEVLQRSPLQITFHKLKINNQPCNFFNSALATSYVLHHQIHKNYADSIFEEYYKYQKNDQQIFPEFDKNNPQLQRCMKIYTQQQKQIQSNLQFYSQKNEKQKDSIITIYVEILTKLSLIYLGLNIWSKSIKLSNKAIEVDGKNQQAIYVRSLALLGKIQQKMKLKNDCKNNKCHICLKQADFARNSLVLIIRQYSQDLEKLTNEIKESQQKIFQTSKIEPEQIIEMNKLQQKIDIINSQVTEAIKAMQHAFKIIQKIKTSITEKNIKELYQISLKSEGQLLEQHQFFQKINEKTLNILIDQRIKRISQNLIESENIKYEPQVQSAIINFYQQNKGIQQKLYSQEENEQIKNTINQNKQIKQEQQQLKKDLSQLKEQIQNQNQNQLNNQENMDLLFKFNRASTNNQSSQKQPNKDIVVQQPIILQPTPQGQTAKTPQKPQQQQNSDVLSNSNNLQSSPQKTKNQKKKQKKKNKIIKDQQQASAQNKSSRSNSAQSEINEIELIDIKINKTQQEKQTVPNNSSSQRNGKSQVVNNDNDDFFQSFQKVSKHAQKIKSKINIQKVEEKKDIQANTDQFIVLQNNYNGYNSKLEINASLKDYMNHKAQRKLNKLETKFIQSKVSQWQDYEKNDKLGHLGFNRMQLSQINAMVIVDKCIEFGFDENKYQDWISNRKVWDEFVAKNIPKKLKPKLRQDIDEDLDETQNQAVGMNQMLKCRKCRADQIKKNQLYENENKLDTKKQENEDFFENHDPCCPNFINQNGMWNFHQTDGQKHQVRIKKLNAVKRNEVFEEKYEETREERELRMHEAERKREIIKQQELKYLSQSDQKQKNHFQFGQAQNLISLSTNESEQMKNRKMKKEDLIQSENQMREQQIRRQRQLLIINGGKDPVQMKALQEALEKAELEKSGFCDENQKKLIQSKVAQKIHQQNINKYVYSSDEYVSESSNESENEVIVQPQDMEDRSTKSVQKPIMHNSIFAFTPYNHYDSNSSKESEGKDRDINAKKVKTLQDLENHWKNNEKPLERLQEDSKESESLNQKQNQSFSQQNKSQIQNSVVSVQSQDSSTGPAQSNKAQVASSIKPPNYKTVLCKWFEQYGKCKFEGCTYAHGQKELMFNRRQNFQSNLSRAEEEVKQVDDKNEYNEEEYYDEEYGYEVDQYDFRYKTAMCKHIQTHGTCPYIDNCNFAHSKAELRKLPNYYVSPY